jgi:hypothetical protein
MLRGLAFFVACASVCARPFTPRIPSQEEGAAPYPSTINTTERYIQQRLDHFSFSTAEKFYQRYFTYEKFYQPGGPIFFCKKVARSNV